MNTFGYRLSALLVSLVALPACGVGTYHIAKVDPVVMPEPEEDLFADIEGLDSDSDSSSSQDSSESSTDSSESQDGSPSEGSSGSEEDSDSNM